MAFRVLDPKDGRAAQGRTGTCALTIMAKAPRPGMVKTRLSPPLTPEQATELNIRFLRDTAENLSTVRGAAGLVSYTPVGDEALFSGVLPESFCLLAQRGEDFGERLATTVEDVLACGFGSVCLIDSDSPTVPHEAYVQAVEELARPGDRVVLGPTADGGYYLIGLKRVERRLFEGIAWSTDAVNAQTLERAAEAGLTVVELPLWYDVDDGATLGVLRAELLAGMAPGFATMPGYAAPRTAELLARMDLLHGTLVGSKPEAGGAADADVEGAERPLANAAFGQDGRG